MDGHLNIKYFYTTYRSPLTLLMTFPYTSNASLSGLLNSSHVASLSAPYSVITFTGTQNLKSLRSERWSEFKTR
jgi:hypothetical protein